jgi:8-oxo-dGTP pyrophosphatase MutT (NUDIX family)
LQALGHDEKSFLKAILVTAREATPPQWQSWRCGPMAMGYLHSERATWLGQHGGSAFHLDSGQCHWHAFDASEQARSAQLQAVLEQARHQGLIPGWRDERFSLWEQPDDSLDSPYFLSVERSGFRFLGMLSHAVHINGFTPQGHLWCGRRSMHKATDPGMLDNVTAGGLPTGESVLECALRELEEEAGLAGLTLDALVDAGAIRTSRAEPEGWHDEIIHVFNLELAEGCIPKNKDGEVSEFVCLTPGQTLTAMAAGAFTRDASAALAQGLSGIL